MTFLPQFVYASRGSVTAQMLVYCAVFAALTTILFALMGGFARRLAARLKLRPEVTAGLNLGVGLTFIVAGTSVPALKTKLT